MMTDTHEGQGLNQCALNDCVCLAYVAMECGCVQLLNIQCVLEKGVCIYAVMHPLCKAFSLCALTCKGKGQRGVSPFLFQ